MRGVDQYYLHFNHMLKGYISVVLRFAQLSKKLTYRPDQRFESLKKSLVSLRPLDTLFINQQQEILSLLQSDIHHSTSLYELYLKYQLKLAPTSLPLLSHVLSYFLHREVTKKMREE
jgi:hypothetical protein